jgi:parvulin-like peptidyl-prolyl isomerase
MIFFNKETFAVFAALIMLGNYASAQNKMLASVDEKAIMLSDVVMRSVNQEQQLKKKLSGDALNKAVQDLRLKTLNNMIEESILIAEFKQNEFPIPNRIIRETMDKLLKRKGFATLSEYEDKGYDKYALEEDAKNQIGMQTLLQEYVNRTISVAPKEIFGFYNQNKDKFLVPELFSVSMLFITAKDKSPEEYGEIVAKCYECTKSSDYSLFMTAVKTHSSGPNPESGGALGYMPLNKMQKEFAEIVKTMKVKEFKGPLIFPGGTYFLYLEGIKEPYQKVFSEVSATVRTHLLRQKQTAARAKYISKLKTKHTVVIHGVE